jgi:hypothetical protein
VSTFAPSCTRKSLEVIFIFRLLSWFDAPFPHLALRCGSSFRQRLEAGDDVEQFLVGDTTTDPTRTVRGAANNVVMFMQLAVADRASSRHQEYGRTHFLAVSRLSQDSNIYSRNFTDGAGRLCHLPGERRERGLTTLGSQYSIFDITVGSRLPPAEIGDRTGDNNRSVSGSEIANTVFCRGGFMEEAGGQKGETGKQSPKEGAPFAAPSISLPKGGGAIRGMGEKFAANPET